MRQSERWRNVDGRGDEGWWKGGESVEMVEMVGLVDAEWSSRLRGGHWMKLEAGPGIFFKVMTSCILY